MSVANYLEKKVREVAREFGIVELTLPQTMAIPQIIEGKNVLLIAPTGAGKTEAALLPVFSKLVSGERGDGIKVLYIAPLRALNRDMLKRFEDWGKKLEINLTVRHGDTTLAERRRQATEPPDMLITTPETLQAILPGKRMREHLKSVRCVIVDEVHEIYQNKRGVQLSVGLERLSELAGNFQRIGLSATLGEPSGAAEFLAGKNREIIVLDATMEKDIEVEVESPAPTKADLQLTEKLGTDPTTAARLRRLNELCLLYTSPSPRD